MQRALLSALSLAALSACEPKRVVTALPIPPERMDCVAAGARPVIPPEYKIDWTRAEAAPNVRTAVNIARAEVGQFVASIRTREGTVAGYVLDIEGKLFACSNDAAWLREWQKATVG